MKPDSRRLVAMPELALRNLGLALALFLLSTASVGAVEFSEPTEPEVWLLTYAPGNIYWQRFGHNSIWIRDPGRGIDHSFNFGYFDFNQPGFLRNFLQGRMLYFAAASDPQAEMQAYRAEGRGMRAQKLRFTHDQVQKLEVYLVNEVQEANRDYLYDYFYANCSTRVRDALDMALGGIISAGTADQPAGVSIRNRVDRHSWPDPWLFLGLQVALGSPIDQPASLWTDAFIPDRLADVVAGIRLADGQPLVVETLREGRLKPPGAVLPGAVWVRYSLWSVPLALGLLVAWFWLAARIGAGREQHPRAALGVMLAWPLAAGIGGCLLGYLWLFTDHAAAAANWNLWIVNPLYLPLAVWVMRRASRGPRLLLAGMLGGGWMICYLQGMLSPPAQENTALLAVSLPLVLLSAGLCFVRAGDTAAEA